jgi:cytidylate kinase
VTSSGMDGDDSDDGDDGDGERGHHDRGDPVDDLVVIAIDGPAGAGKSTVGRAVARRLGLEYLDTGAMYRAVTFAALRRGVPVHDVEAVAELARTLQLTVGDGGVTVDGIDATTEIRGREVTECVSAVAANSAVRAELVSRQRAWARARGGGVIEGRDIGSVVFPHARLKLYVTASPRVRAERRVGDIGGDVRDVEAAIIERDRKDSTRADSPLREAHGSIVVDTTGLSIDEVVEQVLALLEATAT